MYQPNYGYGCCTAPTNNCCGSSFGGYGYALIHVVKNTDMLSSLYYSFY